MVYVYDRIKGNYKSKPKERRRVKKLLKRQEGINVRLYPSLLKAMRPIMYQEPQHLMSRINKTKIGTRIDFDEERKNMADDIEKIREEYQTEYEKNDMQMKHWFIIITNQLLLHA